MQERADFAVLDPTEATGEVGEALQQLAEERELGRLVGLNLFHGVDPALQHAVYTWLEYSEGSEAQDIPHVHERPAHPAAKKAGTETGGSMV